MLIDLSQAPKQSAVDRPSFDEQIQDPVLAFQSHIANLGLKVDHIDTSGRLVRVDTAKRGDCAGWYVFHHGEICAAAFGDWRTGLDEKWCSRKSQDLSDKEAKRYQEQVAQAHRLRKEEEKRLQAAAQKKALNIISTATPATSSNPYLVKKKIPTAVNGVFESRGSLVVPVMDSEGKTTSLQFINPDGSKKFLFGGKVAGGQFTFVGGPDLYICEGYATGASIFAATGGTVVCAFNAGNLLAVSKWIRKACPTSSITICADNDVKTPGNPGVTKGREAAIAISARLVIPDFSKTKEGSSLSDFNDLANATNIETVKAQIVGGSQGGDTTFPPQGPASTCLADTVKKRPAPMQYVFHHESGSGLVPKGIVGVLTASGGTGKTFFLIHLAVAASSGGTFGPIVSQKPVKTLLICGEDPQDELVRRAWDVTKGVFPKDLFALSTYGELGPLMRLDGGCPVYADAYRWLEATIALYPGLELLIFDPMSRFFGLDENNNDHATQWVKSLERLSKKFGLTILFAHHVGKDNADKMSQKMSRGASAFVDGCRWQGGLVQLDKKTADYMGVVDDIREYILFDVPKMNYSKKLPRQIVFKRGEGGVLHHVNPQADRTKLLADKLFALLRDDPVHYSRNELVKLSEGAGIAKDILQDNASFVRSRDMEPMIDYLIGAGKLKEENEIEGTYGRPKTVLVCVS